MYFSFLLCISVTARCSPRVALQSNYTRLPTARNYARNAKGVHLTSANFCTSSMAIQLHAHPHSELMHAALSSGRSPRVCKPNQFRVAACQHVHYGLLATTGRTVDTPSSRLPPQIWNGLHAVLLTGLEKQLRGCVALGLANQLPLQEPNLLQLPLQVPNDTRQQHQQRAAHAPCQSASARVYWAY